MGQIQRIMSCRLITTLKAVSLQGLLPISVIVIVIQRGGNLNLALHRFGSDRDRFFLVCSDTKERSRIPP